MFKMFLEVDQQIKQGVSVSVRGVKCLSRYRLSLFFKWEAFLLLFSVTPPEMTLLDQWVWMFTAFVCQSSKPRRVMRGTASAAPSPGRTVTQATAVWGNRSEVLIKQEKSWRKTSVEWEPLPAQLSHPAPSKWPTGLPFSVALSIQRSSEPAFGGATATVQWRQGTGRPNSLTCTPRGSLSSMF